MSPLNTFPGQQAGRPGARPNTAQDQQQAAWGQNPQTQGTQAQGGQPQWAQQQALQAAQGQQGYAQGYGQPQDYHAAQAAAYGGHHAPNADPYAPQFEPYNAAPAPRASQQTYQPQQSYAAAPSQNWQPQQADPRGYDAGSYMTQAQMTHAQAAAAQASAAYRTAERGHQEQDPSLSDWHQHQQGQHQHGQNDMGFAQAAGGELDPNYSEDDAEYEAEDAPRGRRPMMIVAALAGAILLGGGLAYGYKSFLGGSSTGEPPVIKSATAPSKIKPADAGGKQFAHTDSKIMGRLGEGAATATAASPAAAGEMDANGTRKVATLVVGRDGSIQAPAVAEAAAPPGDANSVPGLTDPGLTVPGLTVVDVLGATKVQSVAGAVAAAAPVAAQAVAQAAPQAAQKLVLAPPAAPQKPVTIAKAVAAEPSKAVALAATGSIDPQAAAAPVVAAKKIKKAAAAAAAAPVTDAAVAAPASNSIATTGGGSNGFVAVLASVPRSNSSRLDALKRFADMQQKYGTVLTGKTPDVAEANLGTKGAYHRLVVGPPGSRDQASSVCTQLKSQGYADCWVTSY